MQAFERCCKAIHVRICCNGALVVSPLAVGLVALFSRESPPTNQCSVHARYALKHLAKTHDAPLTKNANPKHGKIGICEMLAGLAYHPRQINAVHGSTRVLWTLGLRIDARWICSSLVERYKNPCGAI
jgi:hypothetical protein